MLILRSPGLSACRDCAESSFGGPGENRFTAYDPLCRGTACRDTGFPQAFVNASNLTLFVRVTDLVFGGPAPALTLEHSFNMDDTRGGVLGIGWAFSLGDSITTDPDGSLVLRRGTGRTDRFATAAGSTALFPVTSTTDTLARAADGTYTLRTAASSTTRTFSADGRLLSILDGATVRVALDYDSSSHVTAAHYRGNLINFATDSTGRITSIKDATGRSVSFSYTADGRLAQQTNADGQNIAWQYDANGNLTSLTWAGGTTAIAYAGDPGFLAVASVTTPDGAARQYDTPRAPEEIRVTDGNGDATWYTSSAFGLLQTIVDSAGNTVTYTYDGSGNRTRAVNGAGEAVSFTYDSSNNLTGITDAANNRWAATYTTGTTRFTDPNKNVWTLTYDNSGNLAGVTNPVNFTTLATRNAAGQILSLADPKGNKRGYQYNTDGLLTGFTDALGNQWAYVYDGAARTSARTDPAGATIKAAYTPANRISLLTAGDTQQPYDYSGIQRDSLNRLTQYTDSNGNQLTYAYDAAGQLTGITLPGGKVIAYQYDHQHHLSKVSDWQGNFALYRYDSGGWPVEPQRLRRPRHHLSVRWRAQPEGYCQHRPGRHARRGLPLYRGPQWQPHSGQRARTEPCFLRYARALSPTLLTPPTAPSRAATAPPTATMRSAILPVSRAPSTSICRTTSLARCKACRATPRQATVTIPPACAAFGTIAAWSTIFRATGRALSWKPIRPTHQSPGTCTASVCFGK